MERSRGSRSRTRTKMRKKVREKGMPPVTRFIQEFRKGDNVQVNIEPSVQKGHPHPKFHGKIGKVIEKRGKAYLLEIRDKNATKLLISKPVHLKLQKVKK